MGGDLVRQEEAPIAVPSFDACSIVALPASVQPLSVRVGEYKTQMEKRMCALLSERAGRILPKFIRRHEHEGWLARLLCKGSEYIAHNDVYNFDGTAKVCPIKKEYIGMHMQAIRETFPSEVLELESLCREIPALYKILMARTDDFTGNFYISLRYRGAVQEHMEATIPVEEENIGLFGSERVIVPFNYRHDKSGSAVSERVIYEEAPNEQDEIGFYVYRVISAANAFYTALQRATELAAPFVEEQPQPNAQLAVGVTAINRSLEGMVQTPFDSQTGRYGLKLQSTLPKIFPVVKNGGEEVGHVVRQALNPWWGYDDLSYITSSSIIEAAEQRGFRDVSHGRVCALPLFGEGIRATAVKTLS